MAGEKDKVTGYVKEKVGRASGDKRTEAEGKADRAKGKVKDIADDLKEGTKGVRDSLRKG
jgi:uncharacterized protein YjbJ (UPF0337 family)